MSKTLEVLEQLIEIGGSFTYENFRSATSDYGYPAAISEEWVIWQARAKTFLIAKFGEHSVPAQTLEKGLKLSLLGHEENRFINAKAHVLSALKSARASILDEVLPEVGNLEVNQEGGSNIK